MFGSGIMQDLVISKHHHSLTKDNSTRMSAAISKVDITPHTASSLMSNSEQVVPGLLRLPLHEERKEAVGVHGLGTFTSLPLFAGKHLLTAHSLYCSWLS